MTLRVGIGAAPFRPDVVEFVRQAERLGVDSVWCAEFWAGDALHTARVPRRPNVHDQARFRDRAARRPHARDARHDRAIAARAVRGRCILGIGTSGPQVMEGWHGVAFDKPVRRTRETIEIIRAITAGERLDYHGQIYELPLTGSEGRAIRSLMPPTHLPIYVASLGPANLRLTGELADGWIGTSFFPETADVSSTPSAKARRWRAADLADLDLTVAVGVEFTDDVEAAGRRHADGYAFTIGAMGSAGTNFYNNAFERQGYGDDIREVQRLWLAGDKDAARRRVPTAIGLGTNLIGTDDIVRDRLRLYRDAGITTLRANLHRGPDADLDQLLDDLEQLLDLVRQVNDEATGAEIS